MTEHDWRVLKTLSGYPGELRHIWMIASGAQIIADCGDYEDEARLIARAPDLLAENERLRNCVSRILGLARSRKYDEEGLLEDIEHEASNILGENR